MKIAAHIALTTSEKYVLGMAKVPHEVLKLGVVNKLPIRPFL